MFRKRQPNININININEKLTHKIVQTAVNSSSESKKVHTNKLQGYAKKIVYEKHTSKSRASDLKMSIGN